MYPSEQTSSARVTTMMTLPGKIEILTPGATQARSMGPLVRLERAMLWTILVVLCILWLLGVVTSYTAGGLIHLLLLAALVILVINLVSGRRGTV